MVPLALASALAAAPASVAPELAAGRALAPCVAHSSGMGAITASNADALAANGLVFQSLPPPALANAAFTAYGSGSFAASPSTRGQIWAVGYDSGACIVFAIGVPAEPVETRYRALFGIAGTWRPEPIRQLEGARWSQYGWRIRPDLKLVAQTSVRPIPGQNDSFIMTTIVAKPGEEN
jgi:hypothetical protein